MDCIFCKIVAGQIPCSKVYEDGEVLAFLDIAPIHPGHTLVIPKRHFPDLISAPKDVSVQVFVALQRIAPAVLTATGAPAFNVGINNGAAAGQLVSHLHLHLIPRHPADGLKSWPDGKYKPGEADALAQRIAQELAGK